MIPTFPERRHPLTPSEMIEATQGEVWTPCKGKRSGLATSVLQTALTPRDTTHGGRGGGINEDLPS